MTPNPAVHTHPDRVEPADADRRLRFLVIDDDPRFLRALARTFRGHVDADYAMHGRAALDLLELGACYDAVMCDVVMPEMCGPDFYRHVRARFPALAERILFVTGGVSSAENTAFVEEVGGRLMRKPFGAEVLIKRLREVIDAAAADPSHHSKNAA